MKKLILAIIFSCSLSLSYAQICSSCNASGWDTSVPQGVNQTYSVPSLSGATYVWVVTGGLTIVSGQGTRTVTVRANNNGTLYVTRYKNGHSACANRANITIEAACEITFLHEPCYTSHITGCPVPNATSYKWYVNGSFHAYGVINSNGTHWIELGFLNSGNPNYYHLRNTNITVCAKAYSSSGAYLGQDCDSYYAYCFGGGGWEFNGETNEPSFGGALEIYPNPVSQNSLIQFSNLAVEEIESIRLIGLDGKIIKHYPQPKQNAIALSSEELLRGLYILQFETKKEILNRKVLIE